MDSSMIFVTIRMILGVLIIVFLANYLLKYMNTKLKHNNKNIEIVDRVQVTNSSAIAIARITGAYYLISISESGSTILKEMGEAEVSQIMYADKSSDILEKIKKRRKGFE